MLSNPARTAPGKGRSPANLRPRRFRRMSRRDRVEYFAPRVPPERAWLDHPDRGRMALAAELDRLLRQIRQRDLRRAAGAIATPRGGSMSPGSWSMGALNCEITRVDVARLGGQGGFGRWGEIAY